MKFKLSYTIRDLEIIGNDPIKLDMPKSNQIQLIYKTPTEEERKIGHKSQNTFLDIIGEFKPTKNSAPVFEALEKGLRPKEGIKALQVSDMVKHTGPEYGLDFYPNPFIDFTSKIRAELASAGRSVTSIIRWRYKQEGQSSPISVRGFSYWSEQKNDWKNLPTQNTIKITSPRRGRINPSKVVIQEIVTLLDKHQSEPLAHELLTREL
jgi:hypothetical protein